MHTGSWNASTRRPFCEQQRCEDLANMVWPELLQRGASWALRQDQECDICKEERKRRAYVMRPDIEDDARHLREPFAQAPFVHPFNAPKYHAQQLRAINFAKALGKRVLWIVATDKPLAGEQGESFSEERKERWLELHDRNTAGIMGLFPYVQDMPVRFTVTDNREQGVFKHSRGILRHLTLTEEEKARIEASDEPEIVLRVRPSHLYVEVETATEAMPDTYGKNVYAVKLRWRTWTRDRAGNAKVARIGFPLVPDFGGTAHTYCGTTLDAGIGDLLAWFKKPTREDMRRAYIIKSRVREASQLLIVQPHSPALFMQGDLPGPQLLLEVLQRTTTPEHAKERWKTIDKKDANAKETSEK